ncbi:MAG: phosphatase PAP2 family protein [Chloroflexota bacterium]|nr:phosphatase PAP2 family protein [Chloroflexota bacterium]
MNDLLQFQIAFTLWLQSVSPALDSVFKAINFLQTEEFFLLALPIVWWCIDKRIGASLAILFLSSDYFVRLLKGLTALPRPYQLDPRVRPLDPQTDSSFPSAGTMATVIFWGYLATQFRRRALWAWAVLAIVLVALARVYLGAHYPTDVIASIVIGVIILVVVLGGKLIEGIASAPRAAQWIAAIAVPIVLAAIYLNAETAVGLGAMLGFGVGVLLEDQFVRFEPRGVWWKQLLKLVIGLAIALGLRLAIKPLLPLGNVSDMARYALIGLWMGAGAPWVFVAARLARRE